MNMTPGAWHIFLIHFRYAHARFLVAWLAAATGTVSPAIFRLRLAPYKQGISPVSSPTGEAGKNAQAGLCVGLRSAPIENNVWQIYIVKMHFFLFVAFEGTFRKILNMVIIHIKGSRHTPLCLFNTLF
jgi:hypothetical protein